MKTSSLVCVIVSIFSMGCSVEFGDYKSKGLSRIEVESTVGSGKGAICARIKSVDGVAYYEGQRYIELSPGNHTFGFEYEKTIDPGGGFSMTLIAGNSETDIIPARPATVLTSMSNIDVSGDLEIGETYYVNIEDVSFESLSSGPGIFSTGPGYSPFQSFVMKGEPRISKR